MLFMVGNFFAILPTSCNAPIAGSPNVSSKPRKNPVTKTKLGNRKKKRKEKKTNPSEKLSENVSS